MIADKKLIAIHHPAPVGGKRLAPVIYEFDGAFVGTLLGIDGVVVQDEDFERCKAKLQKALGLMLSYELSQLTRKEKPKDFKL